jgi:hypothetical protein
MVLEELRDKATDELADPDASSEPPSPDPRLPTANAA